MVLMLFVNLFINFSNPIRLEEIASLSMIYDIRRTRRANRLETFLRPVHKGRPAVTETRFLTKGGRGISVKLPAHDCEDGIWIGAGLSFEVVERGR
jgi:hypothetical protein